MYSCTKERFLGDVKNHFLQINYENDVNRHISLTNAGSSIYRIDLITWPGHLCIRSDCGTYVFSRLPDMFNFFRSEKPLYINPAYWGEKLESIGTNAGYKEFDENVFRKRIKDYFDMYWESTELLEEKQDCWDQIVDEVLRASDDGEFFAYTAVHDFRHGDFQFQDFFDGGGTESYTFQYIWCLYAISWGIAEYDKQKAELKKVG